jgi:hypothetical protein
VDDCVDPGHFIDAKNDARMLAHFQFVRYLVAPREAGSTKSRLIPKLLAALNVAPERSCSPKATRDK